MLIPFVCVKNCFTEILTINMAFKMLNLEITGLHFKLKNKV
jgi:hypothetical protein